MLELISLIVLCLTRAGARITGGQSEDSDLDTHFRFLLCSLNKGFASKTDLSWSNTFFPFLFSLCCVRICTWCRWNKMSWACVGSPHAHANINTCVQYVHTCVFTRNSFSAHVRVYLTGVPFPNLSSKILAHSDSQIVEYRFPASLLEVEEGWRWWW